MSQQQWQWGRTSKTRIHWHFKAIEVIFKSFVCGKSRHKLPWNKLKNPTDLGGAALPDFNLYYIAGQLFLIGKIDRTRFLAFLCPKWSHSTGDPFIAITGWTPLVRLTKEKKSLLHHYQRIWAIAMVKLQSTPLHEHTPLWCNLDLMEFDSIPDLEFWRSRGIYH